MVAYSKSGKKFTTVRGGGISEFVSTWVNQMAACQDVMGASYGTNYRGYASEDTAGGPWRAWTGVIN